MNTVVIIIYCHVNLTSSMAVEGLLPEPVEAASVTILTQTLLALLSKPFPKLTDTAVLPNVGVVLIVAGDVVAVVKVVGVSPKP
jgi:hypothetical protein